MKKQIIFSGDVGTIDLEVIIKCLRERFGLPDLLAGLIDSAGIDAYLEHALMHHEKHFNTFWQETHEHTDENN
jgi:hypothetical protein